MEYDMSRLLRLAQSPAGQQLMALLQKQGGTDLENALSQASQGNYRQAKDSLSSLLSGQEAKKLLKQLEEEA